MRWIQAQRRTLHFFYLWVCLFWMNGLKLLSLQRMGMWEVRVFLSPGNSYLASGIVLLAWFFTLPGYQCKSRHSFRDWIILLKCYWCVKLVWNQSLATRVSSWGIRKELSASIQQKQSLHANPVPCWDFSKDFTVLRWGTRWGTWISASEPKPQVRCISLYLPELKWSLFSGVITVAHY